LTAISSGAVPPNPTELLVSQKAKDVLNALSMQFDYVIVDSPSLLVTDAAILAGCSQGVLIVARFGLTKRKQLAPAIIALRRAGAPLLGSVLTMTPPKKRTAIDVSYSDTQDSFHEASQVQTGRGRRGWHKK
jgi:receptor protein-tyrosine kinase